MKLRPFELVLIIVFLGLALLSLVVISTYKPKPKGDGLPAIGALTIWGTLPEGGMTKTFAELKEIDDAYKSVTYRYISSEDFQLELIKALADGKGPDLVLISQERLVELRSKIKPVSYDSFPQRDIRSRYLDGAQIFALSDGLYAYPIAVDPLVLYWNRDILAADGFLEPPVTWEALVNDYLPTLIRRNPDRSIDRSVVAMGEYKNIKNAFGIISTLLLQAGMVGVSEEDTRYKIKINQMQSGPGEPLKTAADFYTRFSKPSNTLYSWNRSFSEDRAQFLGEKLALYFGYGSEGQDIERLNPNLSFDIAEVPQGQTATVRRTYGRFYGLAALKTSDNLAGASILLTSLGSSENMKRISDKYGLVPALRSLVSEGSNETYGRVTYKSASVAYGWLSPNESTVRESFETLVQDLNENRQDTPSAVSDTLKRLELEYNN